MEIFTISPIEYQEFRNLQVRRRWDWPAAFSANEHGSIWPFVTFGYTRGQSREEVRGISELVDAIADAYLDARAGGGRFFISEFGAFYKDEEKQLSQSVKFQLANPAAAK
jgi:hypothetical protein